MNDNLIANNAAIVSENETNYNTYDEEVSDDDVPVQQPVGSHARDSDSAGDKHDNLHLNNNKDSSKTNTCDDDPLYDPNGDDEDEAYVYRHLRGGVEEEQKVLMKVLNLDQDQDQDQDQHNNETSTNNVNRALQQENNQQSQFTTRTQSTKILKPRNSDGILSCPCCFQIVCMDCQKHEKYYNQFRAMFVMNIGVDWDVFVKPEEDAGKKKLMMMEDDENDEDNYHEDDNIGNKNLLQPIPDDHHIKDASEGEDEDDFGNENEVYYSVYCNNCRTQVAALDMRDEVYHFFGCIISG